MAFNKTQSLKLGQLLVDKGLLTPSQLEAALSEQSKTKSLLGEILIHAGYVTDEALYRALSEQSSIDYIKLSSLEISPDVIQEVPFKLALHYKLVPIRSDAESITVATSGRFSISVLDDLSLLLGKPVRSHLSSEREIQEAIKKYYGIGAGAMESIAGANTETFNIQAQQTQNIGESSEDASIINFVNEIFREAYRQGASDIHIEPYEDRITVRCRVDGILHDMKVPSSIRSFHGAIISRIKIMSNLDISETRVPQDGRIRIQIEESEMDLRVSVLPTPYGEGVVIRLLSTDMDFGIDKLGLLEKDLKMLEKMLKKPNGVILVTGPTGSGKTTTLYSCLSRINSPDKKIITVEDPIEYRLDGITQMQIYSKINLTFSQALRSILRHDPDIVMVGEIRDVETAEITIRMALTGHLVFSTLHTNDASSAVTRLIDMGVEPFLVASTVQCFIAQRLVRLVCSKCKKLTKFNEEILREFGKNSADVSKAQFYEGAGCEVCRFSGFRGRAAIYEILPVSAAVKELIFQRASADKIQAEAIRGGMRTLRQDGWEKILLGLTTPAEVIRVTQSGDADD